jgi:hypothetical protein
MCETLGFELPFPVQIAKEEQAAYLHVVQLNAAPQLVPADTAKGLSLD